MTAKSDPDQDPYCLDPAHDELAAEVSSLTAENERLRAEVAEYEDRQGRQEDARIEADERYLKARVENKQLRKRLEAAWDRGDEDANQKVTMFVEKQKLKAEIERLREELARAQPVLEGRDDKHAKG